MPRRWSHSAQHPAVATAYLSCAHDLPSWLCSPHSAQRPPCEEARTRTRTINFVRENTGRHTNKVGIKRNTMCHEYIIIIIIGINPCRNLQSSLSARRQSRSGFLVRIKVQYRVLSTPDKIPKVGKLKSRPWNSRSVFDSGFYVFWFFTSRPVCGVPNIHTT